MSSTDFDDDQFISAEDIRNILELIAVNENRKLEDEEIDYLTNAVSNHSFDSYFR